MQSLAQQNQILKHRYPAKTKVRFPVVTLMNPSICSWGKKGDRAEIREKWHGGDEVTILSYDSGNKAKTQWCFPSKTNTKPCGGATHLQNKFTLFCTSELHPVTKGLLYFEISTNGLTKRLIFFFLLS